MNPDQLKKAFQNLLHSLFPELRDRTHLPHKAKVLDLHGEAGTLTPNGPRRYSVDVQPLLPDGTVDDSRAPIRDVPLEVPWTANNRGVFSLPAVGSIVLIGYISGAASYPYVDRVLADGHTVPVVADGEFLVQLRPGVIIRIAPSGMVEILSDGQTHEAAPTILKEATVLIREVAPLIEVAGAQVILAGGGPAVARVGDQVQVVGVMPGSATVTGTIISGSSKVFSG